MQPIRRVARRTKNPGVPVTAQSGKSRREVGGEWFQIIVAVATGQCTISPSLTEQVAQ